jgi:hypothetical protein
VKLVYTTLQIGVSPQTAAITQPHHHPPNAIPSANTSPTAFHVPRTSQNITDYRCDPFATYLHSLFAHHHPRAPPPKLRNSPHARTLPASNPDASSPPPPPVTFCAPASAPNRPNGGHHRARSNEHVSIPHVFGAARPQPHHRPIQEAICTPSSTRRRRATLHKRQVRNKRRRLGNLQEIAVLFLARELESRRTVSHFGQDISYEGVGACTQRTGNGNIREHMARPT